MIVKIWMNISAIFADHVRMDKQILLLLSQ